MGRSQGAGSRAPASHDSPCILACATTKASETGWTTSPPRREPDAGRCPRVTTPPAHPPEPMTRAPETDLASGALAHGPPPGAPSGQAANPPQPCPGRASATRRRCDARRHPDPAQGQRPSGRPDVPECLRGRPPDRSRMPGGRTGPERTRHAGPRSRSTPVSHPCQSPRARIPGTFTRVHPTHTVTISPSPSSSTRSARSSSVASWVATSAVTFSLCTTARRSSITA